MPLDVQFYWLISHDFLTQNILSNIIFGLLSVYSL
jgi:hypothetical protein